MLKKFGIGTLKMSFETACVCVYKYKHKYRERERSMCISYHIMYIYIEIIIDTHVCIYLENTQNACLVRKRPLFGSEATYILKDVE